VAGNANQEIPALGLGASKPSCFWYWKTVLTEVHASSVFRERDIHPIIDKDPYSSSVARVYVCEPAEGFAREPRAVSSRKIFLSNLNPVDADSGSGSNLQQESFPVFA
jgi:hypothetical protein